ncbi:isoprenyl transferase [Oceanobacillus halophilus]|uniref:Isoprenyl transferase n=1 Tax=Oceanobacillus halophilus TaxID=930130 RepID=A0A495ACG8_9BACI|nr:isoprenyl transferase [Oceanobacillus halophilus]RKQ37513.1 isoprenyl transferase [Oceanobacillus halophilus]
MSMKIPFLKKKQKEENQSELENIPRHVAIIMDGNGRWAESKGLPRVAGHKEGVHAVNRVVRAAAKANVEVLTLFAFSTENWRRPKTEIDFLMKLPKEFLHVYLPEIMENNVKIETIGEFDDLPQHTKEAVQYAIDKTKNNDGMLLNFALNYGGRSEIVRAIKHIVNDIDCSKIAMDSLDENLFSRYLYTDGLQDPDLLIRTSGEQRLSNFLLWQSAYTEFWFTDVLWPDFDENVLWEALHEFEQRKRRYGGL